MLEIKNLMKKYGNKIAVNNLSLNINDGEIYGFIGHNGAGKTTTLKCIGGIHPFDDGDIIFNGLSIKDNPLEFKKVLAYLPDNPDLFEYMTGREFINFISNVYLIDPTIRNERIEKYASLFEIKEALPNLISTYSHGMKQKLALISALVHEPKLIIMDEPFVGLDPKASHELKEIMKEFVKNGGIIFFSTHVLEVAEKLCDKVAIIKQGELVVSGSMEEVIKNESLEEVFLDLVE